MLQTATYHYVVHYLDSAGEEVDRGDWLLPGPACVGDDFPAPGSGWRQVLVDCPYDADCQHLYVQAKR
ncbi:MAG: hypothetical protein R3C15_01745 [Thermoleophilia bacterium]